MRYLTPWLLLLWYLVSPTGSGAALIDVESFLAKPRVLQVVLSPAGDRVAYLLRESHGVSLWTLHPITGERKKLVDSTLVQRLHWSTDGGVLFLETAKHLAALPVGGDRPTLILKLDASREREFFGVDPILPRHLLVTEKSGPEEFQLLRVDAAGKVAVIYRRKQPIHSFLLGSDGRLAFVKEVEGREQVIFRLTQTRDGEEERQEVLRCDVLDACGLVSADPAGHRLLLKARLEGDLWRLLEVDTETRKSKTVHQDPQGLADLGPIRMDPSSRTPLLVTYHRDRLYNYGLEPWTEKHVARIEKQFSGVNLAMDARRGGRYWLIRESGPRLQHPRHHLYDTQNGVVHEILEDERRAANPIPEAELIDRQFVSYRATDGMMIHGYVVTPRGVDLASTPVVAMIHGGPWGQVRNEYGAYGQFLANRGYIVFLPNFRASTGYGVAYKRAGKGEFGEGKVQQDILDGLHHLFVQGIGDKERVAIVGHSFGGFATLTGVSSNAEWFRAGIASAAPIDLVRAMRDIHDKKTILMPNGMPRDLMLEELFVQLDDRQAVAEVRRRSPEAHLEKTARPLLMMAGAKDPKVSIVDVKHYALALDELGKDVSLLVDDEVGHSFSEPRIRRAMLYLSERFLAHHLGGAVGPAADPETANYIESTLLLTGESLAASMR